MHRLELDITVQSMTYDPQMNDPRFIPRRKIIYREIALFSRPWSPRIREGSPYFPMASRNRLRTVAALLLSLARKPVIYSARI